MVIYLVAFVVAIIFAMIGENKLKRRKRKAAIFFSILAVMVPCILAAVREPGVGVDSGTYAYTDYLIALRSDSYTTYFDHSSVREVLYTSIVYLTSCICDSFFLLFFVSQMLIVVPVYSGIFIIKEKCNKLSLVVSYAAFLFLYYNLSLSIIRQSMAMSFIFLGYALYKVNNKLKVVTIIPFLLASLSHSFAIVVVLSIVLVDKIINDKKKEIWKKMMIICCILISIMNVDYIIAITAKIIPAMMTKYISTLSYITWSGFSNGDTLMKLVIFGMCFIATTRKIKIDQFSLDSYTFLSAIGITFQFLSIISEYLLRISYYYQFFMILPIGGFCYSFSKNDRLKTKILAIILLFSYWYIVYVSWNWHTTVPFKFMTVE